MSPAKRRPQSTESVAPAPTSVDDVAGDPTDRSIYADYSVWTNRKVKPKWHPIKKMRYVFFRMIAGCTVTDALKEIKWSPSEFWHLIDLKRNDPFRVEYERAKRLQGRAVGDSVVLISEGRDKNTKKLMRRTKKLIQTHLKRASSQKSPLAAKAVIESLLSKLDENDSKAIARNKLQIDAAKWLAKSVNPGEFSDKSTLSLNGGDGTSGDATPILIQFVAPDGSVVTPT